MVPVIALLSTFKFRTVQMQMNIVNKPVSEDIKCPGMLADVTSVFDYIGNV